MSYGIPPAGFRMPGDIRLGAVVLQVADLTRSLAYYEGVLGLQLLRRGEGTAALGAAGATEPIVELRERAGATPVPRHGRLGLYHFAILLPDRPSLGRFITHLMEIGQRAGASDHLVSEALYLHDPDGLGIEVYADRPREEWRHDGDQIVMDTRPLNIDSLVALVGGTPWSGMPPGTVLGHVHLHVGDLRAAERFYHQGLGLDKVVWSYPGALFLSAGGYHHHLGVNTWAAGAPMAGEGDARLIEWEVVVPDARAAAAAGESVDAAGFEAVESADGDVVVHDPWGVGVRLRAA